MKIKFTKNQCLEIARKIVKLEGELTEDAMLGSVRVADSELELCMYVYAEPLCNCYSSSGTVKIEVSIEVERNSTFVDMIGSEVYRPERKVGAIADAIYYGAKKVSEKI